MNIPAIRQFIVDHSVAELHSTRRLLAAAPGVPIIVLEPGQEPRAGLESRGIKIDKTVYYLTKPQGKHFKKCPGITENYVCCNLHVLDQAENCPLACSYCFLQGYLTETYSTLYMDYSALFEEIRLKTAASPKRLFRVGTGELSDSLALDHLTRFSEEIVPFFASLPNAILELKTKSTNVDNLLGLDHAGRTVVAWSVNPRAVNELEEPGCARIEDRLRAAQRVTEAGYRVAFHFDPMIHYEGCYEDYKRLVGEIFDAVPQEQIAWISIGSVRFNPEMKQSSMERYPNARVMLGEIVRGYDGKARYIRPIRRQLYSTITEALQKRNTSGVFTYFCMEDETTWKKFLGPAPRTNPELDFRFAENLRRRFPDLLAWEPEAADYLESCAMPAMELA